MKDLGIRTYPDPFLRKKAEEVAEIDDDTLGLIEGMFHEMEEEGGIGLAAPQVGVSRRIICISIEHKGFERLALINPVIVQLSDRMEMIEEGCLSIPGVNAEVSRPVDAVVRGKTKSGRQIEITAHGLLARVLQHEIDHLDGVLFIDRLKNREKKRVEKELGNLEEHVPHRI